MSINYAYHYAIVQESNGLCLETQDSSVYRLIRNYIPIDDAHSGEHLLKYYWPLPETVTSFDDFQGQWYTDEAHTILADI